MKKKIKVLLTFLIVISCVGISYAIFTYRKTINIGTLVTGDIYMRVDTPSVVTGNSMLPMDHTKAITLSNNIMNFTIYGRNNNSTALKYDFDIVNRKVVGKENILAKFVNVDIYDGDGTYYANDISLQEYKMGTKPIFTVTANTNYSKTFYVRFWVNKNLLISDTDIKADYRLTDNGSSYLTKFSDLVLAYDVIVNGYN